MNLASHPQAVLHAFTLTLLQLAKHWGAASPSSFLRSRFPHQRALPTLCTVPSPPRWPLIFRGSLTYTSRPHGRCSPCAVGVRKAFDDVLFPALRQQKAAREAGTADFKFPPALLSPVNWRLYLLALERSNAHPHLIGQRMHLLHSLGVPPQVGAALSTLWTTEQLTGVLYMTCMC